VDAGYEDLGGEAGPIIPALGEVGIDAEPAVWDNRSVDWAGFDGVVAKATWRYTEAVGAFIDWAHRVEAIVPLANTAAVIGWNSDKGYLTDLSEAGVPTIPTTYIGPGTSARLAEFADLDEWPELVVKPTVSAGARLSGRFGPDERDAAQALVDTIHGLGHEAMVQPYLRAVDSEGESDVLVFGGEISHAVAKGGVLALGAEPATDERLAADQRVRPMPVTAEFAAFTKAVLAAVPGSPVLVQARVDSVLDHHGTRRLMELELIEPYLYLNVAPDPEVAAAGYARAVAEWLSPA
jgi:hypothetical protein